MRARATSSAEAPVGGLFGGGEHDRAEAERHRAAVDDRHVDAVRGDRLGGELGALMGRRQRAGDRDRDDIGEPARRQRAVRLLEATGRRRGSRREHGRLGAPGPELVRRELLAIDELLLAEADAERDDFDAPPLDEVIGKIARAVRDDADACAGRGRSWVPRYWVWRSRSRAANLPGIGAPALTPRRQPDRHRAVLRPPPMSALSSLRPHRERPRPAHRATGAADSERPAVAGDSAGCGCTTTTPARGRRAPVNTWLSPVSRVTRALRITGSLRRARSGASTSTSIVNVPLDRASDRDVDVDRLSGRNRHEAGPARGRSASASGRR